MNKQEQYANLKKSFYESGASTNFLLSGESKNDKTQLITLLKRTNNTLPKFDLGTVPINTGYLKATNDLVINSVDSPAADMSGSAKAQWGLNIQEGLTKTAGLVSNYGSIFKSGFNKIFNSGISGQNASLGLNASKLASNFSTPTFTSGTVNSAILSIQANSILPTSLASNSLGGALTQSPKDFFNMGVQEVTENAATEGAALGAGKGLASTLGKAAGVIGALYSGYNMYNDILGLQDNIGYLLKDLSSLNTESVGGIAYKTYGGYDESAVNKYTSALNAGSKINMTLDGAGIGAGIGSLVGPVGSLVGGAVGALAGLLGGVFGSNHRKTRLEQLKRNWATASTAWNDQNYAEAASQAMRADGGLTPYDRSVKPRTNKSSDPTYTAEGKTNKNYNAKVSVGEQLGNLNEQTMTEIDQGKPHADDQKGYVKDSDFVLGSRMSLSYPGFRFMDLGHIEKNAIDYYTYILNATNNPNTIIQAENAKQQHWDNVNKLVQEQAIATQLEKNNMNNIIKNYKCGKSPKYKCGKTPKYNEGTGELISILPGLAEMAVGALLTGSYAKEPVLAYNSYIPNPYAQKALSILGGLRYDPYNQLLATNDLVRLALYSINSNPYSLSQRANMQSALFNNALRTRADILNAAQEANNKYNTAYGDALLKVGESEVSRAQQASEAYRQQLSQAYARRRAGIETGLLTALKGGNTLVGNLRNDYWTGLNIGLWRDNLKIDREKMQIEANKQKKSLDVSKFILPNFKKYDFSSYVLSPSDYIAYMRSPLYKFNV